MKPNFYLFLSLWQYLLCVSAVSRWAIDPSCTALELKDGSVIDISPHLKSAMHDVVDWVDNAYDAMSEHSDDKRVKKICQMLLGDDPANFLRAKVAIGALKPIERDPSPLAANDPEWRAVRSNLDLEYYCSAERFEPKPGGHWKDTAMGDTGIHDKLKGVIDNKYRKDYDFNKPPTAKAQTQNSHLFNAAKWFAEKGMAKGHYRSDPEYSQPRQNLACHTDLATWYLDLQNRNGWRRMDHDLIESSMEPKFLEEYLSGSDKRTPVDALQTFTHSLIHEWTHTVVGGCLDDRPDKDNCYGWKCIQIEQSPRNADTIAWLIAALKLWKMGYMVDTEGVVTKFE